MKIRLSGLKKPNGNHNSCISLAVLTHLIGLAGIQGKHGPSCSELSRIETLVLIREPGFGAAQTEEDFKLLTQLSRLGADGKGLRGRGPFAILQGGWGDKCSKDF